jgi:hypothetical protein
MLAEARAQNPAGQVNIGGRFAFTRGGQVEVGGITRSSSAPDLDAAIESGIIATATRRGGGRAATVTGESIVVIPEDSSRRNLSCGLNERRSGSGAAWRSPVREW